MQTQNPYPLLGTKIKTALDAIIAALPLNPAFDNLNDALFNAIVAGNPPSDDLVELYIKSVLPLVSNAYLRVLPSPFAEGTEVIHYNEKQLIVINGLLSNLRSASAEQIPGLLAAADEKIAASGLSFTEQSPLFVATATGKAVCEYWLLQIPQPSTWAAYMVNPGITPQAMDALNYANVCNWVSASVQGALLGYGSLYLPKIDFADMMAAYIGATGMAAGKVVFKW